jgi:hypothetical protein
MRLLLLLSFIAAARAQAPDTASPDGTRLLEKIKQRAMEDLASVPNYVCVDSIERSLLIPGESRFRRLDRVHAELAHIEGADRFSWLGNSTFLSRSPTLMIGYGASFGGNFADNRALVFKKNSTKISYTGRVTVDGRTTLRYEYDAPRGALGVANGKQSGFTAARGAFWIDPETLDLLRLDIEGYDIPANLQVQSISDATMYWRVRIGQRIALLARNSEFRLTYANGIVRQNASVFSNCREYSADSTLTFGASSTPQVPPPSKPPSGENAPLQPGLELQLVLDSTLDPHEAAVGDPIRAHILKGAGNVPRGARVYGRINRIINFNDLIPVPRPQQPPPTPKLPVLGWHAGEVLIQIEFSQIEYRRNRAPFLARLIDLVSQPGKQST